MLRQKIAGPDLIFVVLHEGPPDLPGTSAVLGSNHVSLHGASSVSDTELQSKFVGNPICTPAGFVDGHLTDQVLMLLWNSRSTGFLALFSPENLETRGMPTKDRSRLHESQTRSETSITHGEKNPEDPVFGLESRFNS